ncbi:pyridoxal-phosphate dependent enzyme [Rhizobium sp. PP-F2F-G48]|uniref:pyridoxal-phosphate dependent enzyme n=1 Tax=Rhizobium sp. PP-F2F-G48 TaxID=2135651 RepID=UPI0014053713|nr:pyridoxal-phosphate dependent enzyme [Rhizobium sp. PP-F2F-G48]
MRTPTIRLPWLDAPGRTVWAKLESRQLTNSFKFRGAYNAIRKLDATAPIVTASAGNHGLAIAHVAQMLDRQSRIFVPAAASELKLRRLIGMGAEVVPAGRDLFESTQLAKAYATEIGGAFISPFSHPDVIVGQGSLAVEVLDQAVASFDQIAIPLGGGGLLAGFGTCFRRRSPPTELVALHPAAFRRSLSKGGASEFLKPIYPTIADGLAVQHDDGALGPLLLRIADRFVNVEEALIEAAIVAMLQREGQLVEGAGAIGVAALLADPDAERFKGNVLLLVCGGNLSTTSLMQALATRSDDPVLARILGNQSISLPMEAVRYKQAGLAGPSSRSNPGTASTRSDIWRPLVETLSEDLTRYEDDLDRHHAFAAAQELQGGGPAAAFASEALSGLKTFVSGMTDDITASAEDVRSSYRMALQSFSYLRNSLSWCSASVDQSKTIMFFDPAENSHAGVNYDRYGSNLLRERELDLLSALGHDPETEDLLLTSSGQAAFSVIESFLIRDMLPANPKIVMAPYIYFEAMEQVLALKHARCIQGDAWDVPSLIGIVEEHDADLVMLDPLANLGTLHTIDFQDMADRLGGKDWSSKWLVVDGTMVSGGLDIFSIFSGKNHPQVLYYESGSKYLQFGLDLQMAGVVVSRKTHAPNLSRHRRNLGAVMYQSGITRFPRYDRATFLARMSRLTENAERLTAMLRESDPGGDLFSIAYPRQWRALGWAHGGGIVSLTMCDHGLNNRGCLDFLIDRILHECRKADVAITKGVSFGFSTTRVSAAAAMANDMPPFLRFSIGEETDDDIMALAQAIIRALDFFFPAFADEGRRAEVSRPYEDGAH